jgi:hypothetical protein
VLSKIFEALYVKIFVNIVIEKTKTLVYIEMRSKKELLNHAYMDFPTTHLSDAMIEFILRYTQESPYYYIALLDTSKEQGAIPTCTKSKLLTYYDISESEYKCFNNTWSLYTSKSDLYQLEKTYNAIGLDFIFSPFTLLYHFFKDKVSENIALFVLVQEESISLTVFQYSQLLYAKYIVVEHMSVEASGNDANLEELEELEDPSFDDSIDLEDMDVDDQIESLEDFGDIEDLDSIEDIEQFSENKDIEEELFESEDELRDGEDETFQADYQKFTLIEKGVSNFYSDDRYESEFIENIYIADATGVSGDLKKYLEEEMFLNVYIRKIDLCVELCELSKEELN